MTEIEQLCEDIKRHEGFRETVYKDTRGYPTIGYGFALHATAREYLSEMAIIDGRLVCDKELADKILFGTLGILYLLVKQYIPGLKDAGLPLTNLAYNIGIGGLMKFKKTIALYEDQKYADAAHEVLRSPWAGQVGVRSLEVAADILKLAKMPEDEYQREYEYLKETWAENQTAKA